MIRRADDNDAYEAHKDRARARNKAMSVAGRDIGPPPDVVDLDRKKRASESFRVFCETFLGATFSLAWSRDHEKVIAKIEQAVLKGGLFAMAMPRGSGKSSITEAACLWSMLIGAREFVVLIGASPSVRPALSPPVGHESQW